MASYNTLIDQIVRMFEDGSACSERSAPDKVLAADKAHAPERFTWEHERCLQDLKRFSLSNREIAERINVQFGTHYTAKGIEQRWQRSSNPQLKKGNWSRREDEQLQYLFTRHHGDVDEIVKDFPQRSRYQIYQRLKRIFLF